MKQKLLFKIVGMHCTSCAMNIDGELEDTEGVFEAKTSYAKAQTEVTFDEGKVGSTQIQKIIKSVGYDAIPQA